MRWLVIASVGLIIALLMQPVFCMHTYAYTSGNAPSKIIFSFSTTSAAVGVSTNASISIESESGQAVALGASGYMLSVQSSSLTGTFMQAGNISSTINNVPVDSNAMHVDFSYQDTTPGTYTMSAQLTQSSNTVFTTTTQFSILGQEPQLHGEYFNSHAGSYTGMNVGFDVHGFGAISGVAVDLYQNNRKIVTNTGTQALYDLLDGGQTQVATSFYTQGFQTSSDWNVGQYNWGFSDKPTAAVITVIGTLGTASITITPLDEVNGVAFQDLINDITPPTIPIGGEPNNVYTGSSTNLLWEASVDDSGNSPMYKVQYARDAAFTDDVRTQSDIDTPTLNLDNLEDGTWYWRVKASDTAGNTSSWSNSYSFVVDTQPPKIVSDLSTDSLLSGVTAIQTTVTDRLSFTWELDIYLASDPTDSLLSSSSGITTIDTTSLMNGKYIAVWVATDQVGNTFTLTIPFQISNSLTPGQGGASPLPQVALAPLFFAPTPVVFLTNGMTISPLQGSISHLDGNEASVASNVRVPENVDSGGSLPHAVGLQTSQSGWRLFGMMWYWWLCGGGLIGIIVRQVWFKRK
jgi:hypothetical protein